MSTSPGSTVARRPDPPPKHATTARSPSSSAGFELLESKLRPPRARGGMVARREVISRLEGARATPVVALSAGPGWGKSTLLAQWARGSRRPFAWVDVDEGDNDPIVLLTYVATALDRISPLSPGVFGALASPGVSVEGTVVPRLGAALAGMDHPLVLALDDLHALRNAACLDAIAALTKHVPDDSQMVLSGRGAPAIPLGALRARGLALEIGPDDLRMDEGEARELLGAAGLNQPDEQISELTEHTEGWPAGLYLAALSIRERGASAGGGVTFSGDDRLVSEYLMSELLASLSPDVIRFLTRTAVLDRMSGPLCDAVLEQSGSAEILESAVRSNMFLVPLDAGGEWYRYHHLFGELLRSELARVEPDLVPTLLIRAREWCTSNGLLEEAIGYAQEAGDVDAVARLVEARAQPAYQGGRAATVRRWLDWLEHNDARERNAAVAVLGALAAAVQGRPTEAERWAAAAEVASYDGRLYDGSSSIDSWLALLGALSCRHGAARMRTDAELAVRTLARASQFRPTALLCLGVSHMLVDEVDDADDLFADAVEEGLELGAPEPAAVALAERAAIAIGREAWVQAEEFVNRALPLIRRSRMEEYPSSALAYALAARLALHASESARAGELLARAQRLRPRLTYVLPWLSVQTRMEMARAYLVNADVGGARTMLREIDALLRRQPDLGALPAQAEPLRSSLKTMRADAPGASTLTAAELRLVPYLGTHLSFREVGERLYISRHTVKSQAMAIYRKLSVASRSAAVERARALGLL